MTTSPPNRRDTVESWWPILRDIASYVVGVSGFLWQMVVESTPEPTLLAASIALIGLPVAAKVQRRSRKPPEEDS